MAIRYYAIWLLFTIFFTARTSAKKSFSNVSSCNELYRALQGNSEIINILGHDIDCPSEIWKETVFIKRNITVKGSDDSMNPSLIDWKDNFKTVVLERGYQIEFCNLILVQDNGIILNNFHLDFLETRDFTTSIYSHLVFGCRFCYEPIERDHSFFIMDSFFGDSNNNTQARFCNSFFRCGAISSFLQELKSDIKEVYSKPSCYFDNKENYQFGILNSNVDDNQGNSISTLVFIAFVLISLFMLLIVCFIVFLIIRKIITGTNIRKIDNNFLSGHNLVDDYQRNPDNNDEKYDEEFGANIDFVQKFQPKDTMLYDNDPGMGFKKRNTEASMEFKFSDLSIRSPLAKGSFGTVYKAFWQGLTVAVKIFVHKQRIVSDIMEPTEANLSRQVSHPNIIQTFTVKTRKRFGSTNSLDILILSKTRRMGGGGGGGGGGNGSLLMSTDDVFTEITRDPSLSDRDSYETWIISEYCEKGSLANAINEGVFKNSQSKPKMIETLMTALDVARALNYLHSVRIIHGDIKAENILLKRDTSDRRGFICKVGDFGMSRFIPNDTHIETFTYGTITHMPPELLKGGVLTQAADVYSFGILLWELFTAQKPYNTNNHGEIILAVVNNQARPKIPDYCPEGYSEIIRDCWRQNHLERPGFEEMIDRLKHLLKQQQRHERQLYSNSVSGSSLALRSHERSIKNPDILLSQLMKDTSGWTIDDAYTIKDTELNIFLDQQSCTTLTSTQATTTQMSTQGFDYVNDGAAIPAL